MTTNPWTGGNRIFEPVKEIACFAWGKFTYSENLAFRILAVLYDFSLMVTYACLAGRHTACTTTVRKVYE